MPVKAIAMPYLLQVSITCVIADGTARLCNVFHAALMGTLDIVAEWEECVGA